MSLVYEFERGFPDFAGLEPNLGGLPNLVGLVEYTPLGWSASSIDMLRLRSEHFAGSLSMDDVRDTRGIGTPPTVTEKNHSSHT